jgi:hypothetical protein
MVTRMTRTGIIDYPNCEGFYPIVFYSTGILSSLQNRRQPGSLG